MVKVIENVTITYTDGLREQFNAICITDQGVTIGRILKDIDTDKEEFFPFGFINKNNIKKISSNRKKELQRR